MYSVHVQIVKTKFFMDIVSGNTEIMQNVSPNLFSHFGALEALVSGVPKIRGRNIENLKTARFSNMGSMPIIWIYLMFYDHLSAHSWLNWVNEDDLIECFTTTFLRPHSWLNWADEDDDEVGLKEKPEDTRYIKKITSK